MRGVSPSIYILAATAFFTLQDEKQGRMKHTPTSVPHHASILAYSNAVVATRDPNSGVVFYVESDGRKLVSIEPAGTLAWATDLFTDGGFKPLAGKPVVRDIRLEGGLLHATCGKSDVLQIDPKTGNIQKRSRD